MILVVALLGVASLQADVGSTTSTPGNDPELFQADFGECIARYKPRQARQFVIGRGRSPIDSRCLRGEWARATFLEATYRYRLARALIQRDYAAGVPDGIATVEQVDAALLAPRDRSDADAPRRLALADCVVRRAPIEAFALAQAHAGQPSAAVPMSNLASIVAACATAATVRYLSGFQIQEAIVTRLYQLAYAARKPDNA